MSTEMKELHNEAELGRLLQEPCVVIFKHSTRCSISTRAQAMVQQFADEHPSIPVYVVRVIESRQVSNYLAGELGVRHQSPQVLFIRFGEVVWHGSHFEISQRNLNDAVAKADCAPGRDGRR